MKKLLAALLCLALAFTAVAPAFAAAPAPRLYNVYANGMLFQRDAEAVFAGEAPSGAAISAELYNAAGTLVRSGTASAADGRFTVSFTAPAGGYDAYTVKVRCNGAEFAALRNVVFGELWLAFGQSNMEYALRYTPEGKEMLAANETGPRDLHVLYLPPPYADGAYQTRYLPQTDAIVGGWFTADDPQVFSMSAPAYFFAVRLQQTLDMPVGVLSVPVGGSSIAAWLSREAIDGSETVKRHLVETGGYYGEARWSDPDRSILLDMTNLYNTSIAPIVHFRPQGAIWYQGCTDLMFGHSTEYYRDLFDLMQDSYTADFGCSGGRLPFIFTQLACFDYGKGPFSVTAYNDVFTELAKADPASRGEITIYDLPLEFNEMGYIHPMTKKPVGERMETLAEALVYGAAQPSTAAFLKSAEARDGGVYLTFENVGEGLCFVGGAPRGFAVCGADGVAVEAEAELVSADTVRVFSEDIEEPVAAAYAAGNWSERANLWSTANGRPYLPAAPCGISDPAIRRQWADNAWMNCEDLTFFASGDDPGYIDAWKASGCAVSVETADKAEGDGALRISAKRPLFSLSPATGAKQGLKTEVFDNVDADWTEYGALRLRVKNLGDAPVRLNEVRLCTGEASWCSPVCAETGQKGCTVPADGAWHTFTFELNRLLPAGAAGPEKTNDRLGEVKQIRFRFEGAGAELLLDDIRVLPEGLGETASQTQAPRGLAAYLKALWRAFLDKLLAFFGSSADC